MICTVFSVHRRLAQGRYVQQRERLVSHEVRRRRFDRHAPRATAATPRHCRQNRKLVTQQRKWRRQTR